MSWNCTSRQMTSSLLPAVARLNNAGRTRAAAAIQTESSRPLLRMQSINRTVPKDMRRALPINVFTSTLRFASGALSDDNHGKTHLDLPAESGRLHTTSRHPAVDDIWHGRRIDSESNKMASCRLRRSIDRGTGALNRYRSRPNRRKCHWWETGIQFSAHGRIWLRRDDRQPQHSRRAMPCSASRLQPMTTWFWTNHNSWRRYL